MTTTVIGEKRSGTGAFKQGDKGQVTYSETVDFLVFDDTPSSTTRGTILTTAGLPKVNVDHSDSGALCTAVNATRREDHPGYWDVSCEFETQTEAQDTGGNQNPTLWKPQLITVTFINKDVPLTEDAVTTDPICNAAGERFSEPLIVQKQICSVPFTQYEDGSLTLLQIMAKNNKCNDGAFLGAADYTLLLHVKSAKKVRLGAFLVWEVNFEMLYDPDGWKKKVFNVGPNYYDSGELHPCMDSEGQFKIIGNLDSAGAQIFTDVETLEFSPYPKVAFSTLIRT